MSAKVILDSMDEGYRRVRLVWPQIPLSENLSVRMSLTDRVTGAHAFQQAQWRTEACRVRRHDRRDATFALLRQRLLLKKLDSITDASLHNLVIQEASAAAEVAAGSGFPLLIFPCLFEEKAARALESRHRHHQTYWRGLESPFGM
jgi:hypothetical protein